MEFWEQFLAELRTQNELLTEIRDRLPKPIQYGGPKEHENLREGSTTRVPGVGEV